MVFKNRLINRDIVLIFVLYTLSHGLILINQGIYWDDWILYNVDGQILIEKFTQAGAAWTGYFHQFMLSLTNSFFCYHLLVFLAYFFASVFVYKILKNITELSSASRLFIAIFFAIFPVNSARIALIDLPYALCYFMFFLGFYILNKYMITQNILFRLLALIIIFFSFSVNSFLMFYSVIFLFIIYKKRANITDFTSFVRLLLRHIDFILLPFIFWIIRILYLKPHGLYTGYNNLGLSGFVKAPLLVIVSFFTSFLEILGNALQSMSITVFISGVILSFVFLWFIKSDSENLQSSQFDNMNYFFILFGLVLFVFAIFPYAAVNKLPLNNDWHSRHQLLIPLGAAFILYYAVQIFSWKFELGLKINILILSLTIAMFTVVNINSYIDFQKDWYKQLSVIENFKRSDIIKNNNTFIIEDNFNELNANDRYYRFYEYTGMLKAAFSDEKRFAINKNDYSGNINDYAIRFNSHYNLKNYKKSEPQYVICINKGLYDLDKINIFLKLLYYDYFKEGKFSEKIVQVTSLSYIKI